MRENEDANLGWVVFGAALIILSGFISFCALPKPPADFNSVIAEPRSTPTPHSYLTGGG